jgi:hypothetical protein
MLRFPCAEGPGTTPTEASRVPVAARGAVVTLAGRSEEIASGKDGSRWAAEAARPISDSQDENAVHEAVPALQRHSRKS